MTDVLTALKLHLIPRSVLPRRHAAALVVVLMAYGLENVGPLAEGSQGQPMWVDASIWSGLALLFGYFLAATRGYSHAIALGLTRTAFCLGALLLALVESLGFGIVLTALEAVQRTIGLPGEGMPVSGVPAKLLGYAGPALLSAAVGLLGGTLFKRWGYGAVLGCIGLSIVWLSWMITREALAEAHFSAVMLAWPFVAAVAVTAVWYPMLHRTDA